MTYGEILRELELENRLRSIPRDCKREKLLNLCTNDYLGLAEHADYYKEDLRRRFPDVAMTSSASRLLASDQDIYARLEAKLEEMYERPALFFNSGYHANVGTVSALGIPGTLILTDKLIHASVIDGVKLGKAPFKRFAHNDMESLERILKAEHDNHERIIVICESIYSMDGDRAPLAQLVELKRLYPKMLLYVDEAHSLGVYGPYGEGLCKELGLLDEVDFLIGTFGKAVASQGAFVACSEEMKTFLLNSARSFIFSTAIPPVNVAWTLLMLEQVEDMLEHRAALHYYSNMFKEGIESITGLPNPSESQIIPLQTGNARKAIEISRALEQEGILALPIRRPTVPPGGERIRFSLSGDLSLDAVSDALEIIKKVYREYED